MNADGELKECGKRTNNPDSYLLILGKNQEIYKVKSGEEMRQE